MKIHKIISTLLICVTVLLGFYFISKTSFSIKNTDPQRVNETTVTNSIAVQGQGKVYVTPDTAILNFTISSAKMTTQEAQKVVNESLEKFKQILKDNSIETKNIQTQNINIYTEYDYSDKKRILRGYKVSQSIKVTVRDITNKHKTTVGDIVNKVSEMGGLITIDNMRYDIWDKTKFYSEARKLAMQKAEQKVDEISKLAGVSKDRPLSISENIPSLRSVYPMYNNMNQNSFAQNLNGGGEGDYISLGTMEVIVNLNVVYGIK